MQIFIAYVLALIIIYDIHAGFAYHPPHVRFDLHRFKEEIKYQIFNNSIRAVQEKLYENAQRVALQLKNKKLIGTPLQQPITVMRQTHFQTYNLIIL